MRNRVITGGWAREVTARERRWHPNTDEWQYYSDRLVDVSLNQRSV